MHYPISFFVVIVVLVMLVSELWLQRRAPWALPMLLVYLTVAAWYLVDFLVYGDKYVLIPEMFISRSYWQVAEFLVAFRLSVLPLTRWATRSIRAGQQPPSGLGAKPLFYCTCGLWLGLFLIAVSQMDWDFFGALFPVDARTGNLMWMRAAAGDAGPFGFLISTGGYLYLVTCSFFGILVVLLQQPSLKLAATGMILLTWPFYLMSGTRNIFLAVSMPWVFAFFLFGRQKPIVRVTLLVFAFLALDSAFRVVITYRNIGFRDWASGISAPQDPEKETGVEHEGLNMSQELCFINIYSYTDQMHPTWGLDYLSNLLNFVPRAIWPGKPMAGMEYAKWRGFEGGDSDIGVVATISSGLIGQGVLEFGPLLGPLAPACMMAVWCALLTRWWSQRASVLRLCLFLLGIGVTFNLGRNISALILWPVAFAFVLIILAEKIFGTMPPSSTGHYLKSRAILPKPKLPVW